MTARRRTRRAAVLCAAALSFAHQTARAADHTWIGPSGGNWSVAGNWAPNGVPQPGGFLERTLLDSAAAKTVFFDYDYSAAMLNSVEVQSQPTTAAEVTLQLNSNPGTKKFNTNNVAIGEYGHGVLL